MDEQIWTSHPQLKSDELLSGWIARIAANSAMTLEYFLNRVAGLEAFNLRELDSCPHDHFLEILSKKTGIAFDRIKAASFLDDEGYAYEHLCKYRYFYLRSKPLNSSNHKNDTPYCPECMASDKEPYYRRCWMYDFYTICSVHKRLLSTRCPHCNAIYSYSYSEHQSPGVRRSPITACWHCKMDIRDIDLGNEGGNNSIELLNEYISIQNFLIKGIDHGCFDFHSHGRVHSETFFNVLRRLRGNIVGVFRNREFVEKVLAMSELKKISQDFRGAYRFTDAPRDRMIVLYVAFKLTEKWPLALQSYAKITGIKDRELFWNLFRSSWFKQAPFPIEIGSPFRFVLCADEFKSAEKVLEEKLGRHVRSEEVEYFVQKGSVDVDRNLGDPPCLLWGGQKVIDPKIRLVERHIAGYFIDEIYDEWLEKGLPGVRSRQYDW